MISSSSINSRSQKLFQLRKVPYLKFLKYLNTLFKRILMRKNMVVFYLLIQYCTEHLLSPKSSFPQITRNPKIQHVQNKILIMALKVAKSLFTETSSKQNLINFWIIDEFGNKVRNNTEKQNLTYNWFYNHQPQHQLVYNFTLMLRALQAFRTCLNEKYEKKRNGSDKREKALWENKLS